MFKNHQPDFFKDNLNSTQRARWPKTIKMSNWDVNYLFIASKQLTMYQARSVYCQKKVSL